MKKLPKGITRFTYGKTAFNGFRISVARRGVNCTMYISAVKEKSVKKALDKTLGLFEETLGLLEDPKSFRDGKLLKKVEKRLTALGHKVKVVSRCAK